MDNKCYGDDIKKFIKDLNPSKWEKLGLEYILTKITSPIIIPKITPNKILERYWNDYGEGTIRKLVQNEEDVKKILNMNAPPSEMLETAVKLEKGKEILSNLPQYNNLPPLANLADRIARGYKTVGEREVVKIISNVGKDTKEKSLAYAFLLAIGRGQEVSWKYSPVEKELGEHLQIYAKKLLKEQSQKYHDALQELVFAAGSTEKIG